MMYFESSKNVDIAEALGISVVTLARRHYRILAKLKGDLSLRKWTRPSRDPAEE
jgi:DNA-directed RNA polymerase specialized sigma subunit